MSEATPTCWTLVRAAAAGDGEACNAFAKTYLGIVRAFLGKRWRTSPALGQLDDAVQEVFLDLFRENGALARLEPGRARSFRGFLFGVAHKVALRYEERARLRMPVDPGTPVEPHQLPAREITLSRAFDREWALALLRRAAMRQETQARAAGPEAQRRVELLRLRFVEDLPIRTIADRWGEDPAKLHHDYARAREEFKDALRAEVRYHMADPRAAVEREVQELLSLLADAS